MKRSILKMSFLLGAVCGCFLWSSCRNNGVVQPSQKDAWAKIMPPPPPQKKPQARITDVYNPHQVFTFVEQMPSFPGGETALMQYLHDHISYPKDAREKGISGTVVVQFIVNRDGSLSYFKIPGKHLGGGLEQESINVVQNMPKWIPGSQEGVKVNVRYALPVRYVLQ